MNSIITFDINNWLSPISGSEQQRAIHGLENGNVLFFPNLPFHLHHEELAFLNPTCVTENDKNVSYNIHHGVIRGSTLTAEAIPPLKSMMHRYAETAQQFAGRLFAFYGNHLRIARTSYRPVQIAGRVSSSYRKDDSRLHVDAFPASPVGDKRILRVFTNVNPNGEDRVWRVGDYFSNVADTFIKKLSPYRAWQAGMMKFFKITRNYRSAYDHYMLMLHNAMKADERYQKSAPQSELRLPPGSTWIVYSDVVSHAAMSGQYVFEQTFNLPVHAMSNQNLSPLRVLENKLQRKLFKDQSQ